MDDGNKPRNVGIRIKESENKLIELILAYDKSKQNQKKESEPIMTEQEQLKLVESIKVSMEYLGFDNLNRIFGKGNPFKTNEERIEEGKRCIAENIKNGIKYEN